MLTAKNGKSVLLWWWVYDGRLLPGAIDHQGYMLGYIPSEDKEQGYRISIMCIGKGGKLASLDYGSRLVDGDADPKEYEHFVAVGGKEYKVSGSDVNQRIAVDKFGDFTWNYQTLTASSGFYYVSALGEPPVVAEGAYEVDFSGYDAVIKTYREMLPYLTEGLSDDVLARFSFSDHTEYETFYAVFKAARIVIREYRIYGTDEDGYTDWDTYSFPEDVLGCLGYALYDVNHDGSDELDQKSTRLNSSHAT